MRWFVLLVFGLGLASAASADMAQANQAMAAKDYAGAISGYEGVLAQDPSNAVALRQLGTAYYYSGDKSKALAYYNAYLDKQPSDAGTKRFADALRAQGVTPATLGAAASAPGSGGLRPGFGIRGSFGLGLPMSLVGGSTDLSTGSDYPFGPGAGLTFGGEFLWAFHPQLELGLGLQLIGNSATYSSKDLAGTTERSATEDSSTMPIDLTLYAVVPMTGKWNWVLGFGPAMALGGTYNSGYTDKSTGSTTKYSSKYALDMGFGYHGFLGAEYGFGPSFSILAGLDLESINLTANKYTSEETVTNGAGVVTYSETTQIDYVSSPPKKKAPTTTVSGNVQTTDNGVEVDTDDYVKNVHTVVRKEAKSFTIDYNRIAPVLKATYRF